LAPADPILEAALQGLIRAGYSDPAEFELRVLTEYGIIFVSWNGMSAEPDLLATAVRIDLFLAEEGSDETFWASPEGRSGCAASDSPESR
jgi:hypothetical protein